MNSDDDPMPLESESIPETFTPIGKTVKFNTSARFFRFKIHILEQSVEPFPKLHGFGLKPVEPDDSVVIVSTQEESQDVDPTELFSSTLSGTSGISSMRSFAMSTHNSESLETVFSSILSEMNFVSEIKSAELERSRQSLPIMSPRRSSTQTGEYLSPKRSKSSLGF